MLFLVIGDADGFRRRASETSLLSPRSRRCKVGEWGWTAKPRQGPRPCPDDSPKSASLPERRLVWSRPSDLIEGRSSRTRLRDFGFVFPRDGHLMIASPRPGETGPSQTREGGIGFVFLRASRRIWVRFFQRVGADLGSFGPGVVPGLGSFFQGIEAERRGFRDGARPGSQWRILIIYRDLRRCWIRFFGPETGIVSDRKRVARVPKLLEPLRFGASAAIECLL